MSIYIGLEETLLLASQIATGGIVLGTIQWLILRGLIYRGSAWASATLAGLAGALAAMAGGVALWTPAGRGFAILTTVGLLSGALLSWLLLRARAAADGRALAGAVSLGIVTGVAVVGNVSGAWLTHPPLVQVAVLAALAMAGVLVGAALPCWMVSRRPNAVVWWVLASVAGSTVGLGLALLAPGAPLAVRALAGAAAAGGTVFGAIQWLLLRRLVVQGGQWALAGTLGLALGGSLIIGAAAAVGNGWPLKKVVILLVGVLVGLVAQGLVRRPPLTVKGQWLLGATIGIGIVGGLLVVGNAATPLAWMA